MTANGVCGRIDLALLERARKVGPLSAWVADGVRSSWNGHRPFHSPRPTRRSGTSSFTVSDAKGFFHCLGCQANGDLLEWLRRRRGIGLAEAVAILTGEDVGPRDRLRRRAPVPTAQGDLSGRFRSEAEAARFRRDKARAVWGRALPFADAGALAAPVLAYLREARGIAGPLPRSLRWNAAEWHPFARAEAPCLVAAVQDDLGGFQGVWRVWVTPDGAGKAELPDARDPDKTVPARMGLGPVGGGAVRLAKLGADGILAVTEGIETGLAVREACTDLPVWAALSAGGLARLRVPADVQTVVLCPDNDPVGRQQAGEAVRRFVREGLTVRIADVGRHLRQHGQRAPKGFDLDDLLRVGMEAVS